MKTFISILAIPFLSSCSNFNADKLEGKEQTLELEYIAWACDCANWAKPEDIDKYSDEDTLVVLSVFIEPAQKSLTLPDTLGYNGDIIKFTGQFYKDKGFPKDYESYEEPEEAKVFRYAKYEVVRHNKIN
jgi:hypothetical protein